MSDASIGSDSIEEGHLEHVLAEFLAAEDAGECPDPFLLIERNPDLRIALESFFGDRDQFQAMLDPVTPVDRFNGQHAVILIGYFGDYELIEELGRGGMGVVYKARQLSLNRLVALKMIGFGRLADVDAIRRFRNEAEAVARLDHPNVLTILEVGEHNGYRYFSMPLINGGSLADDLSGYRDNPKIAARLLVTVAAAVHHAHQRGILHRDLKPANILVDEQGQPHVADFGLAKNLQTNTNSTATGAIIGTPAYMAPEQASGRCTTTTVSDVYGLGAILYALLAGRSPFPGDSPVETIRRVREEMPERLMKLNPAVDRDLETICLKCLEKDGEQRYASAQDLASDLARWLDGRPIVARPVGPFSRARMWCRRNPALAGSFAALIATIVLGVTLIGINWIEVRHQKDLLQAANFRYLRERDATRSLNEFLVNDLLAGSSPFVSSRHDVKVVDLLDRSAEAANSRFAQRADLEASIRQILGDSYRALGYLEKADTQLTTCLELGNDVADGVEINQQSAWHSMGLLRLAQGKPDEAESYAAKAFAARLKAFGGTDPATLDSVNLRAVSLKAQGRLEEAEAVLRPAIEISERRLKPDHRTSLELQGTMAVIEFERHLLIQAEQRLRLLERRWGAIHPTDSVDKIFVSGNLGAVLLSKGDTTQAGDLLRTTLENSRRLLGNEHDVTLTIANNLGVVLHKRRDYLEASLLLKEVVAGRQRLNGEKHMDTLRAVINLAATHAELNEHAEAIEHLQRILPDMTKILPKNDSVRGTALTILADSLRRSGKLVEAESAATKAVSFYEVNYPGDSRSLNALSVYASVLLANKELVLAKHNAERVLNARINSATASQWTIAATESLLGEIVAAQGDHETARFLLLKSYETLRKDPQAPPRVKEDAAFRIKLLIK